MIHIIARCQGRVAVISAMGMERAEELLAELLATAGLEAEGVEVMVFNPAVEGGVLV